MAKERKTNQIKKQVCEQKIKLCEERALLPETSNEQQEETKKKSEKKDAKKKEEKKSESKKEEKKNDAKKDEKKKEEKKDEKKKEEKKDEKKEEKTKEETKEEVKKDTKKEEKKKETDTKKIKREDKKQSAKKEETENEVVILTEDEKADINKTKQQCLDEIKKLDELEVLLKTKQEKITALKETYMAPTFKENTVIDLQDSEGERKYLPTKKLEQAKDYLTEKATYDLVKIEKKGDKEADEEVVLIQIDESLLRSVDDPSNAESPPDQKKKQAKGKASKK